MNKELALISEVMSDAYYFLRVRGLVETWETEADNGNATAQELLESIHRLYRLCTIVKNS